MQGPERESIEWFQMDCIRNNMRLGDCCVQVLRATHVVAIWFF